VPLSRRAGTQPNRLQYGLGRGPLPYQVASSYTQPFGHNRHAPKTGGLADVYLRIKWHLDPCSRFATIGMGQKLNGVGVPSFLGVAGSPWNTKSTGARPISIPSGTLVHLAVWPQRTLAPPLFGGWEGGGSPSNTKSPGLKPISIPSAILTHPAVWTQ